MNSKLTTAKASYYSTDDYTPVTNCIRYWLDETNNLLFICT